MKGMGRTNWLKLGGLGILLFLAVYGLVALESSQRKEELPAPRTTYSASAGGYKALYLWLQALNIPIQRWEKRLGDLPPAASVLMMVDPELGPGTGELEALKGWVSKGGTFVLVISRPNAFLKNFDLDLEPGFGKSHKNDDGEMFVFQPGPYTRGVRTLHYQGHPGLVLAQPEAVIHLRSEWGGLLAVLEQGKGRLIVLTDPNLFSNELLREADHPRLALNLLLTHLGDGSVLVDEYHHGYGRATSVFDHLTRSKAIYPALQGFLLLLIFWAAKGRRFGPPRPLVRDEHRSSLEYVRAMAQLFQRAQARGLALEAVSRWIEEDAKKILVYRDHELQRKLLVARKQLGEQEISERELLTSVRTLYAALDEARGKH
jgi:hypothetical protein